MRAAKTEKADQAGMAKTSTRTLWKGAITFGLVHIPIALYSATAESGINFDWIDKRSMDPVGYKRVNKRTGKEINKEDIVKGIEWEDGEYVIISPEEIAAAYPKSTQTIEIEAFIPADDIPFVYLERPYYVAPVNRGEKVYALLRETLREADLVAVAKVVIQTKQHLAVLIPCGPALVLNLLRWGGEIRSWEELKLPPVGAKAAGLKASEMAMARELVKGMTAKWSADQFRDSFRDEIMKLAQAKAKAGETKVVQKLESPEEAPRGANVLDLTELLKRSLGRKASDRAQPRPSAKTPAKRTVAKKVAPSKPKLRRVA
ncbi:MAG TPA: Ku protein [Burkholderiaceae bacterium]|nr:Ku protein [Burkholderiaceae bacterium]